MSKLTHFKRFITQSKILSWILAVATQYMHPRGTMLRNNIAYSIMMALAPTVALLTILSLYTLKTTKWLYDILIRFIPENLVATLLKVGLQTSHYGFIPFIITLGISYYSASRGFYAIMLAFCSYDEKTIQHHNLMLTIQSLIAPLAFISLVIFMVFINATLPILLPNISFIVNTFTSILLYHILSLIFFYSITYPKKKLITILPGASFFAIGLTGMGFLFFFYIQNFTNYTDIYGSIASIIILLLSTHVISVLMHIGACINRVGFSSKAN